MTQKEFLEILKAELEKRGVSGLSDILRDYEEHFAHAKQNGKTEDEISAKLGHPKNLAMAFETDTMITQLRMKEEPFSWKLGLQVIGRFLILAPFNFFVLFIPGVILFALIVAGWSVVVGIGGASLGILGVSFGAGLLTLSFWAFMAGFATSLGLLGMSVMFAVLMAFFTQQTILAVVAYCKWNLQFLLENQRS